MSVQVNKKLRLSSAIEPETRNGQILMKQQRHHKLYRVLLTGRVRIAGKGGTLLSHSSRSFHIKSFRFRPPRDPSRTFDLDPLQLRSPPPTLPCCITPKDPAAAGLYPKKTAKINTLTRPFLRRPLPTRVTRSLFSVRSFAHWSSGPTQPRMAEQNWTGLKVRQTFFEYFEKKGHTIGMSLSILAKRYQCTSSAASANRSNAQQSPRRLWFPTMTLPFSSPTPA